MVNALFGKCMGNVRKRRKVDLVSDTVKLEKLLAKQLVGAVNCDRERGSGTG
jgi:hypothetical protein